MKPKCIINTKRIQWISPDSEQSKTDFVRSEYKYYLNFVKSLVKEFDEGVDISPELNVITVLQLYFYYATHHELENKYDKRAAIMSCFIITQSLFSDSTHWNTRIFLENLLYFLDIEDEVDVKKIQKYQKDILQFFDNDFQTLPLSINYIIYLYPCLGIEEPTNENEYNEKIQKNIQTKIYSSPSLLSMEPKPLTMMILPKVSKIKDMIDSLYDLFESKYYK